MKRWRKLLPGLIFLSVILGLSHTLVSQVRHTLPDSALVKTEPVAMQSVAPPATVQYAPVLREKGYVDNHGEVTVVYTTEAASSLLGLTMRHGFFEQWRDEEVIISDQLAISMFLEDDVLGYPLVLNGKPYTVCGVYALDRSILGQASQTSAPEVYLPMVSHSQPNPVITEFWIGLDGPSDAARRIAELEAALDTRVFPQSVYNLSEERLLAEQSVRCQWLLLAVVLVVLFAWRLVRQTADLYAARSGATNMKRKWIFCALWFLGLAGAVALLQLASFELYLPQSLVAHQRGIADYLLGRLQWNRLPPDRFLYAYSHYANLCMAALCILFAAAVFIVGIGVKRALARFRKPPINKHR